MSGPPRDSSVSSCPPAGTLNTLDKAPHSSSNAGSQVASVIAMLGLAPTGPASVLAAQQTGPLTIQRKASWVFLLAIREQRAWGPGAGGNRVEPHLQYAPSSSYGFPKNHSK